MKGCDRWPLRETGTKGLKRFEIVTQPPEIGLYRALQSLSLWKYILIVQGCGVQPS